MKNYLINLETINANNLSGIETLTKTDKITLLYKDNIKIDISIHILISNAKCQIQYKEMDARNDLEYGFMLGKIASETKNIILIAPPSGIANMVSGLGATTQDSISGKKTRAATKKKADANPVDSKETTKKAQKIESVLLDKSDTQKKASNIETDKKVASKSKEEIEPHAIKKESANNQDSIEAKAKNIIFKAGSANGKSLVSSSNHIIRCAKGAKGNVAIFSKSMEECFGDKAISIIEILGDYKKELLALYK